MEIQNKKNNNTKFKKSISLGANYLQKEWQIKKLLCLNPVQKLLDLDK